MARRIIRKEVVAVVESDPNYGRCDTCKHYQKLMTCSECSNGSRYSFDYKQYYKDHIEKFTDRKLWTVRFYTPCMPGTEVFCIVAKSEEEAHELWEKYLPKHPMVKYLWDNAIKGEQYHSDGFTKWKYEGYTNENLGITGKGTDGWDESSDHIRD